MELIQRLFKSVSAETRIKILLLLLRKEELSVSDIASALESKISTISRNLSILEKDSFVTCRHVGSSAYYSINDKPEFKYNRAILNILKTRLKDIS